MTLFRYAAVPWIVASLLSCSHGLGAQDLGRGRLADIDSLSCVFSVQAMGTWPDGEPQATVQTEPFTLQYGAISTEDGTAEFVRSRYGVAHIIARLSAGNLHLLEVSGSGSLYATTVFDAENSNGTFKAVHSRHAYIERILRDVTSRPYQYYGECEVVE